MGYFSGHLMSSASNQKLFCEVCSAFNCYFDEFVGEKVVSPSYSSTILAPLPNLDYTVEVTNGFKGLDLIDRVPEELWTESMTLYRRG